jgi:cytochrome c biogenesis protein CcdA
MVMDIKIISVISILIFKSFVVFTAVAEPAPVQLDLFFSAGCTECEQVKTEVLPELEGIFAGQYELHQHDITISENIPLLLAYQQRCGNNQNGKVSIVIDRNIFFSGYNTISTGLVDCINEALIQRQYPGWNIADEPVFSEEEAAEAVSARASAMTFSVVAIGGLVDGLNPCAISTLIFFISLLVLAKVNKRVRLMVGISFIFASFVVYTAMGLGFIYALRQAPSFDLVKKVVEICIGLGMIPLAYLSFRDAFLFRKSTRPDDVTLKIPKRLQDRIHSYMNSRLGVGGPILGGLIIGAGVTILESVCTGQSYLPVLMYMLKGNLSHFYSWTLLIVYNLLFVLPLAIVFICFHRGMEVTALISWSKRNLVVTKILLGLFFTTMAILLLW